MGNCLSYNATEHSPSNLHTHPARAQETAPSAHPTSTFSSHGWVSEAPAPRPRMPAHNTAQHNSEMIALSQDSASSQRRRYDRDHPPPSSASNPRSHPDRPHGGHSHLLHKSMSTDTIFSQGPHSHSPGRITRTTSTVLLGHGPQPTGAQFESGPASGTSQIPAKRQEHRPHLCSALQIILSNDFRCVVRYRALSHNNSCTILHRFRILVAGKVCILYRTDCRRSR